MTSPEEPVRVRVVSNPLALPAALAVVVGGLGLSVVISRRHYYGPLLAHRTARAFRRWASQLEDAGHNMARRKESM